MELFEVILGIFGFFVFYSWVYGAIVVAKKTENLTENEKFLLVFGGVGLAMYVFRSATIILAL